MEAFKKFLVQFFGVVIKGQTYLNALYLLLAFPLGLFYFIFLVTGLSIGVATIIIWIGLFFLLAVFAVWYGLIVFERQLTIWLLREDIPPISRESTDGQTAWQRFVRTLKNPVTWKGLVYLLTRFPLGIASFVVLVTMTAVSLSLFTLPLYYSWAGQYADISIFYLSGSPMIVVDTLPEALFGSLIGALLGIVSLHIFNGMAWVSGKFARVMLGNFSQEPISTTPAEPPAPGTPEPTGAAVESPSPEAPAAA